MDILSSSGLMVGQVENMEFVESMECSFHAFHVFHEFHVFVFRYPTSIKKPRNIKITEVITK